MKRLIALVLCLMMLSGVAAPVYAADKKLPFEPGKPGTFWAPVFGSEYEGYDDIVGRFVFDPELFEEQGAKAYAQQAATKLNNMPEGRRVIQLKGEHGAEVMKNSLAGGYIVNPEQKELVKKRTNDFFKELKALNVPVDIVFDDMESYLNIWNIENAAIANFQLPGEDVVTSYTKHGHLYEEWIKNKLINETENTKEYKEILKPALIEDGYIFGDDYDLKYINIHPGAVEPRRTTFFESNPPEGAERAYLVFGSTIKRLASKEYDEAVFDPIYQYYPDVKCSNWRDHGNSGELDVYDFNGNLNQVKGDNFRANNVGTHANWVFYGCYKGWAGWIESRPPREWRYDTFLMNGFNQLKVDYIELASAALSNKDNDYKITVWISNNDYSYDNTPYYTEAMFHAGMFNPDPFLFYEGTYTDLGSDLLHLEDIFDQLDELVGHDDRKTLMTKADIVSDWDYRYILSGMYAGGKNVWRISPDLFTKGATMENFLVDEDTPTFRIGNQNIEFPEGSYIYKPENEISQFGYWIISPEGSGYPREWRDDKHPMPGDQTVEGSDGMPLGYTFEPETTMPDELDLSRSRDKKNTPVAPTPDDGEQNGEVAPPVVDIEVQTLKLNPMMGDGEKTEIFLDKLPADAQNHWAKHTLANMFALGIMKGTGSGMEPDNSIARAEFLAMLERILGAEEIEFAGEIPDVKAEDWYATVIQTAVSGGWMDLDVVTGKANPEDNITRAEMCSIMVKALSLTGDATASFTDNGTMTAKVRGDVAKAAAAGLIEGYEDGSFRPNSVLTRAETATLFERLLAEIPVLFAEED